VTRERLDRGVRATLAGLAVNAVLAGGKFVAGVAGHSHALVADAVESMADIVSSLVVWRALVVASEPPDEDHPYGHGKAEPIAAAIVGLFLLAASGWIAFRAIGEIMTPHTAPAPFTLAVLVGVIVIKEGMFRFAMKRADELSSAAVHSDAWHHRSDALTSLAAGIGIAVSLIGGPGYEAADDVAALLASLLIAWNGWKLARRAASELMDTVPGFGLKAEIGAVATEVPMVHRVQKCLVRQAGYHLFVDMHVHVDPEMSVREAHAIAHQIKDRVRQHFPRVHDVLIHIEPAESGELESGNRS
jgi:cation diffusion facilitator family transporter